METHPPTDAARARARLLTAHELAGRRPPRGSLRLQRGVYLRDGAEPPPGSREHLVVRCVAGLLAAGAGTALSHRFGGALLGVAERPGPHEPVAVRLPPGRRVRARPTLAAHRTAAPLALQTVGGLPVVALPRTLLDLAATERLAVAVFALARAEALRVLDLRELLPALEQHPGTPGVPALREAIEIVERCGLLIRSLLEAELLVLCLRSGLPLPVANARVATDLGSLEVDALWPSERVVVETDGFAFHSSSDPAEARRRFVGDRARWSAIEAAGHRVLVYAWDHVLHRPHVVRAQIAATLGHARQ